MFPHHPSAARLNPCHVSERVTHGYPLPGMCKTHMLSLILTNQFLHPPASELNLFSSFKMCGSEFYVKILMQSPIPSPLSPSHPKCGSVFIFRQRCMGHLLGGGLCVKIKMRMTRSLALSCSKCEYQERGWKEGEMKENRLIDRCLH